MNKEQLNQNFTYHAPSGTKPEKYALLRSKAKELANLFDDLCIDCREKSLSITKLEEAIMWINAGIARNPEKLEET